MSDDPSRTTDALRDWTRVLRTAQGFGKKFGRWPTHLRLPEEVFVSLKDAFGDAGWADLQAQVTIAVGGDRPEAREGDGDEEDTPTYRYGESLVSRMTYTVKEPEPEWLSAAPLVPGGDSPEPDLRLRLTALGHTSGEDLGVGIQRAVLRMANTLLDSLEPRAVGSPDPRLGELTALLRHPRVAHELTAAESARVQRAVLKVAVAELMSRLRVLPPHEPAGDERSIDLLHTAEALDHSLGRKPLPLEALSRLRVDPAEAPEGREALAEELDELVEWASALAVLNRRTGPIPGQSE